MSAESGIYDITHVPSSGVRGELNTLFHLGLVLVISEEHISILERMFAHKEQARILGTEPEMIENLSEEQQQAASIALQTASSGALDAFSSVKIIPNVYGKEVTLSSSDILGLANLRITKILNQPVIWLKPIDLTPAVAPRSKFCIELTKLIRNCMQCAKTLRPYPSSSILFWQTMEFCNQYCLLSFQKSRFGSKCHYCNMRIIFRNYGLYGVRFGIEFLVFCSQFCFDSHKRHTILCSYCEIVITNDPAAQKITMKKHVFCSTFCCEKYFDVNQNVVTKDLCYKCKIRMKTKLTFQKRKRIYKFCSENCFAEFKLAYDDAGTKIVDCVVCSQIFENHENFKKFSVYVNSAMVNICSMLCHKFYLITFRKLISCQSCLVKKFNTDMIRRTFPDGVELTACSIYCLMMTIIREQLPCEAKMICKECNERFQSLYWYLTIDQTDVFCSKLCIENALKRINGLSFLESQTNSDSVSISGTSSD